MLKTRKTQIMAITTLICIILACTDMTIIASYSIKSAIKIVLFAGLPLIYAFYAKDLQLWRIFKISKNGFLTAFLAALCVAFLILGSYFAIGRYFDFSDVVPMLEQNLKITKRNFLYVSIYIAFINSLLEEFFFRGFAFFTLKRFSSRKLAYFFSSLIFSLYHITIMLNWVNIWLFSAALVFLFIGGVIFNYFNEKYENIYMSWLVHMFANFAINAIGFMLMA